MRGKLEDWVTITPSNTALLVIDMQVDFFAPNGKAALRGKQVSQMQNITNKLERFSHLLSDNDVLTIFTRFVSGKNITPKNLSTAIDKMGYDIPCKVGSGGEKFYSINPPKKAIIIDKPHYDSFAHTSLNEILKKHDTKNILVTGVRTEICVDATAKRAASEGYDSFIISDLVATYDDNTDLHNSILESFEKYYGFVVSSNNILSQLKITTK